MGILSSIKSWFAPKTTTKIIYRDKSPVAARYENSLWTDDNARNWWGVDMFSAKSAHSYQVRRQLRLRSRYELANNPFLFGICNNNADDLIDAGPTLKITGPSNNIAKRIEKAWQDWCDEVRFVEKIRTCKLAKTVDGEGFLILKSVDDLYSSVKLFPVDVEADQVTSPMPTKGEELWLDGITLHPITGNPVSYHVLKRHPGDMFFSPSNINPLAVDEIPARFVIHWFLKFRPSMVRGVPVFSSALDLFSELRAYRKAILNKAELAAQFTVVTETEAPANYDDQNGLATPGAEQINPLPFDHIPIDRGTMTNLPAGYKAHLFDSGEPADSYGEFQKKCLSEACRPLAYPLNLALGTSEEFNFSSAKLDHLNYRQSLRVERKQCETHVLNPILRAWLDEAVMVPGLADGISPTEIQFEWHWPGFVALDSQVDAQADIEQLAAGNLTYQQFWAERGYDWKDVFAQQAKEREEIERLGLKFGDPVTRSISEEDIGDEEKEPEPKEANNEFNHGLIDMAANTARCEAKVDSLISQIPTVDKFLAATLSADEEAQKRDAKLFALSEQVQTLQTQLQAEQDKQRQKKVQIVRRDEHGQIAEIAVAVE